jgi:hypothetical protein
LVVVHSANLQDRESVNLLMEPVKGQFPRMEKVWVDQGYTGKGKTWIETHMGWNVEVVERSPRRGWIMTQAQSDFISNLVHIACLLAMVWKLRLSVETMDATKNALEPLRLRYPSRCASRGICDDFVMLKIKFVVTM